MGPRGPIGPRGARGQPGNPGPMGMMGPPGETPDDNHIKEVCLALIRDELKKLTFPMPRSGPSGMRGLPGRKGSQGERGERGPQGMSVRGEPGMMGNPGPRGPPGYGKDGRNGEAGRPGPRGGVGNPGPQGPVGAPGLCDPSQCYPKFPTNVKGPGEKGPEDEPEPQAAERESPVETFPIEESYEAYDEYNSDYAASEPVLRLSRNNRRRNRHRRNHN